MLALWKQSAFLWSVSMCIVYVDNKFFTKNEKNLHTEHLEGAFEKAGPMQVPRLPSLKHTSDHCLQNISFPHGCQILYKRSESVCSLMAKHLKKWLSFWQYWLFDISNVFFNSYFILTILFLKLDSWKRIYFYGYQDVENDSFWFIVKLNIIFQFEWLGPHTESVLLLLMFQHQIWCFDKISDAWYFGKKSDFDYAVACFPNIISFSNEDELDSWFYSFFHQYFIVICV